jgi:hypothetical protein
MDMKTFKTLEFIAIFGAIGWFWWNQRQDRLRREDSTRTDDVRSGNGSDDAGSDQDPR